MRDGLSSCETEGECRNKREEVLGPSSGKRRKRGTRRSYYEEGLSRLEKNQGGVVSQKPSAKIFETESDPLCVTCSPSIR